MPTTTTRRNRRAKSLSKSARTTIEGLESRQLLSAALPIGLLGNETFTPVGSTLPTSGGVQTDATPAVVTAPYSPAQIRHFYGVDSATFNGVAGTGAGQTIAIIAVDNEPNITSDLATFDAHYGLAAPPSFVVENQNGAASPLPTSNSDYGEETALDVEWSHAMAPSANILLIEITDNAQTDPAFFTTFISVGVGLADRTPGVTVVSMSYGTPNYSGESSNDSYFQTPGITYVAAAGDDGSADADYPGTSPYVVAAGGTSIFPSDSSGTYGTETTWNESSDGDGATGGGIDTHETKPTYQSSVTQSATYRTTPDISVVADPDTGVYIYDSYRVGGYVQIGGTSLSTPLMAGIFAIVNQGRTPAGATNVSAYSMSGYSPNASSGVQTLSRLYQLPSADIHDITQGTNNYQSTGGYNASSGYDLASGLGSPVGNKLIPDLAGGASVTGQVFVDDNSNGVLDGSDTAVSALAGQTVYLDLNNDGIRESNEPTATINASGGYTFSSLVTGGDLLGGLTGTVRLTSVPSGYAAVGAGATFTTAYNTASTANVGLFPTVYTDSTAGDAYTVRTSPTSSSTLQVLINGTVAYSAPESLVPSLSFTFTGTNDSLVVDFGNGNPVPAGGIAVNGSSASAGFALSVLGTSGNDSIAVNSSSVAFGSSTITYTNVAALTIDPRGGIDSLSVTSTAVTLPASTSGLMARQFSSLTLSSSAKVTVAPPASHAARTVLSVAALSIGSGSTLDLTGNDMDISASSLSAVNQLVATGYAHGTWSGTGITSSTAAGDSTALTALGVIQNNQSGTPLFSSTTPFDGLTPNPADVLVKFTYYGDANLSGTVDGSDYSLVDGGYAAAATLTGWFNGDFNYDGAIDGTDYSVIDNAFNEQTTALPSVQTAAQPAAIVATASSKSATVISTPKAATRSVPATTPAIAASPFSTGTAGITGQLFGDGTAKNRRHRVEPLL